MGNSTERRTACCCCKIPILLVFQSTQSVLSSMQTSRSANLPMPVSRRRLSTAFDPDDLLSPLMPLNDLSDLSDAVLSDSASFARSPLSGHTRAENVECPKCSKRSIIRRSPNTFDCLNCNFHKELAPVSLSISAKRQLAHSQLPTARPIFDELEDDSPESDKAQPLVFAAIAVIIGIIIL